MGERFGRKLVTLAAASLLALGVGEVALRRLTDFPIHAPNANRRPSAELLWVAAPSLGDIDERGFRNPRDVTQADLVALGDSHTYGFNVSREESWPYQAARMLDVTVYNLGMGGYGALQYLYLLDQALALRPRAIVVGVFVVNDLDDYCRLAPRAYWRERLEAAGLDVASCDDQPRESRTVLGSAWDLLRRSAIASAANQVMQTRVLPFRLRSDPSRAIDVAYGSTTSLVPRMTLVHHATTMDVDREPIGAGLRATEWVLERMAERVPSDVQFGVLLVPSKENVLFESVSPDHPLVPELAHAVTRERQLTEQLERFLEKHGVLTASPIDCLQANLASPEPLYPRHADGHPLAAGYRCYAEVVARMIRPETVR